jgi:predicted metalloprotease with PDZ domain
MRESPTVWGWSRSMNITNHYEPTSARLPPALLGAKARVITLSVMTSCSATQVRIPARSNPDAVVWSYDVTGRDARLEVLTIEARVALGASDILEIDDDAAPYVHDVRYAAGRLWVPVHADGSRWHVPCPASECRVLYRFALREAADKLDNVETAIAADGVVVAPPSTWLLHPEIQPGRFRFHMDIAPPSRFIAGTRPSPNGAPNTFEAATAALESSSFAVFGDFQSKVIQSGTARIIVAIAPSALALNDDEIANWVSSAVHAIAVYYGRFPVDQTLVIVIAGKAGSPTRGETLGNGGPAVLIRVGRRVTAANIRDDWVITHELLHVTLPTLSREHVWLSEGIPSYVEPLARARAGLLSPEKLWGDLVEGLPLGLPEQGDQGLENTHTWGRTYWGGALFCLLADVSIRERTANRRSLDDALRAVVATGANVEARWDIEQFLATGDRATGTDVLHELFRQLALAPGSVDLPSLWARLGVCDRDGRVTFDDAAPLAPIRRSMTTAPSASQR